MDAPILSILIPNFDNGRASSGERDFDFLGELLRSLESTLADDPTPLEILVADDGSTDDSLETCRAWARRAWPRGPRAGAPFLRLFEHEHCGVLSVVANRLTAAARGRYCARLDGDIVVHTPRWASRIVRTFEQGPPELAVVGPRQLGTDGRIHSAGSWILHPRGHHHVAQGADPSLVTRALEVDHVMGCFYCHRRSAWESLGGYDESILRGQTVDFGLRVRKEGWRTWAIPDVTFTHYHAWRARRGTRADSTDGMEHALDRFAAKWGFDRLAPDLDVVAERYAGTGLLWNARVFGPATAWPPPAAGPIDAARSTWGRYGADETFRRAIDLRVEVVETARCRLETPGRIVQVGCREGLLAHLLAQRGLEVVGLESDPRAVELAQTMIGRAAYPGAAPRIEPFDGRRWSLADGSADLVLLFDLLEQHPNPVGVLREARRVVAPGGGAAMLVRQRSGLHDADDDALHAYLPHELVLQVQASRCFTPVVDRDLAQMRGVIAMLARRRDEAAPTFHAPEAAAVA